MGGPGRATNLLSKPASPVAPPVDNCLTGRTAGLWRVAAHLPLSGGSWLNGAAEGPRWHCRWNTRRKGESFGRGAVHHPVLHLGSHDHRSHSHSLARLSRPRGGRRCPLS